MGGWWLALAAAGFWAGALAEGLGERGPGAGGAIFLLALGSGSLVALVAIGPRLRRAWMLTFALWALALSLLAA